MMICKECGEAMVVVYAEQDAEHANVTIETWHCEACGETVTEPNVEIIILDRDPDGDLYDDPYYGDPYEPYTIEEDQGWGQCPECNSYLYNAGAVSDGDGDLYDELMCPLCQEPRGRANEKWFGLDGETYDSIEEMMTYDMLYLEDDEEQGVDDE